MVPPALTIFTRPMCILCAEVKARLQSEQVPFEIVDVPLLEEQLRLAQRFGARSFPLLVLRGRYLGGYTHIIHLLTTGRLAALLAEG
jgi:glutaredoxin